MSEEINSRTACTPVFDMDEPMIWTVQRVSNPVNEPAKKPSKTGVARWTLRTLLRILNGH